eukprot:gene26353-biopygen16057
MQLMNQLRVMQYAKEQDIVQHLHESILDIVSVYASKKEQS